MQDANHPEMLLQLPLLLQCNAVDTSPTSAATAKLHHNRITPMLQLPTSTWL
jgi:hypothetical protein